jgi:hypothetical protein
VRRIGRCCACQHRAFLLKFRWRRLAAWVFSQKILAQAPELRRVARQTTAAICEFFELFLQNAALNHAWIRADSANLNGEDQRFRPVDGPFTVAPAQAER